MAVRTLLNVNDASTVLRTTNIIMLCSH